MEIFLVISGHFAQSPLGERGETNPEVHVHRTESWRQIEWCVHLYNPFSNHVSCFPPVEPLVQSYFSDYMHKITPSGGYFSQLQSRALTCLCEPACSYSSHLPQFLIPKLNGLLSVKVSGTAKHVKSPRSRSFVFGLFMKNCKNRVFIIPVNFKEKQMKPAQ